MGAHDAYMRHWLVKGKTVVQICTTQPTEIRPQKLFIDTFLTLTELCRHML